MANQAYNAKKTAEKQQNYQKLANQVTPKRPVFKNCVLAFLVGGFICIIGQCFMYIFEKWFHFDEKTASNPTVATLILISVILTSCGVYDKISQWAGAGTAVPVTGFANSMCSAALEHRSEGLVLGVGGNMFKLAGSVIVFGTVAAFFVGLLHWMFTYGG
ncbi:MAG: putative stage sporulation protein [Paenibacillaceae bacterium]|jgi:stage V sporulation protein AC|nr:putative stage sporulation protein [Paenibacillaceae bacterium]